MIDRLKRLRLLGEAVDQVLRLDARVAGDVVDRLFRVERRALAADHLQGVDHVAAELQHAALEDREKADRPGAYDGDISGVGLLRQATSPVIGCALVHESRARSEEHTSELQSLMRSSYAVCCLKKNKH